MTDEYVVTEALEIGSAQEKILAVKGGAPPDESTLIMEPFGD